MTAAIVLLMKVAATNLSHPVMDKLVFLKNYLYDIENLCKMHAGLAVGWLCYVIEYMQHLQMHGKQVTL